MSRGQAPKPLSPANMVLARRMRSYGMTIDAIVKATGASEWYVIQAVQWVKKDLPKSVSTLQRYELARRRRMGFHG